MMPFISMKKHNKILNETNLLCCQQEDLIHKLENQVSVYHFITKAINSFSDENFIVKLKINFDDDMVNIIKVCFIADDIESNIDIYIYKVDKYNFSTVLKLFARAGKSSAYIDDIQCDIGKGYGSLAMKELIDLCKNKNLKSIKGWLSPVDTNDKYDSEHFNRIHHFYTKHGFEIINSNIILKI